MCTMHYMFLSDHVLITNTHPYFHILGWPNKTCQHLMKLETVAMLFLNTQLS